ncbi:hypothetical protein TNCV_3645661 [Trichonephila clavipes]|nr:hypothetical protein TNCV_3645661 [Trichonephila clavipes]
MTKGTLQKKDGSIDSNTKPKCRRLVIVPPIRTSDDREQWRNSIYWYPPAKSDYRPKAISYKGYVLGIRQALAVPAMRGVRYATDRDYLSAPLGTCFLECNPR